MTITDSWHRQINYLRVSVTDRCNLRCTYCMPAEGVTLFSHNDMLSYEEIASVIQAAADIGISKIRLTGGEPLVRLHLDGLVRMISEIPGIDDISLTTNGVLLADQADILKKAGLKRVNISLDSLKRDRFALITRRDKFDDVMRGIEAAKAAALNPVKINMVVMRDVNEDEVADFAQLTITEGWHVRFIELMPFTGADAHDGYSCGVSHGYNSQFVSTAEIREKLHSLGQIEAQPTMVGNGPARYYRFRGARGTIGFISPVTEHFCASCNRLRLTAIGKIRPCLLSDDEVDLRHLLRSGASGDVVREGLVQTIRLKPERHNLALPGDKRHSSMSQVGG